MAANDSTCLVCGRAYKFYDAAPRFFCSVGCEADAGPVKGEATHRDPSPTKGRAAKTPARRKVLP